MLHFTENQANAILEMRLYKLIGLEVEALQKEHETTLRNIATYEDILENHSSMSKVIKKQLDAYKKEYARPRKTIIEDGKEVVYEEKKMEEMPVVLLMDRFGYTKAVDTSTYERNKDAADSENKYVIPCMNTDKICIFTDTGRMHTFKVLDVPFGKFREKGTPVDNLSHYDSAQETMIFVCSLHNLKETHLLFATKLGMFKKVHGSEFDVSKRTVSATKLQENDAVIAIKDLNNCTNIVIQTAHGFFLRCLEDEIPEKKKGAIGVRGIRLAPDDTVENVFILERNSEQTTVYKDKELILNKIKLSKRDTKGTKVRI